MKIFAIFLVSILALNSWAGGDEPEWESSRCKHPQKMKYNNLGDDFESAGMYLAAPGAFGLTWVAMAGALLAYSNSDPFIDFSRSDNRVIVGAIATSAVLSASAFGIGAIIKKRADRGLLFLASLKMNIDYQRAGWPRGFRSLYTKYGSGHTQAQFAKKILILNEDICVPRYKDIKQGIQNVNFHAIKIES
ncbi:MAG: hypothetical protein HOE90_12410 [Bacteriovoracaceae bacterium]|nr:hypothetical protein [Bacteriovoracaceae bacterium]